MPTKKEPLRTCIGCGEGKTKKELLRIVKTPEGEIMLDPGGRKNGRGAYVCRNAVCMEKAAKTRGLDRSFRENVPREVYLRLAAEVKALAGEADQTGTDQTEADKTETCKTKADNTGTEKAAAKKPDSGKSGAAGTS